MPTFSEIAAAAAALPPDDQRSLLNWLSERTRVEQRDAAPPHGILDIAPVSLGKMLCAVQPDDDVLGEMLEHRA